ncbi:cytochrome P450 2H1-like isoform X4 [Excalfactoria chinensis]|uniref:cytochrome P450 2H1-like isoform X4 n=1 Tax=Excalfactoria chinensis TaxID=46218 RepID=UPI003B3BC9AB
MEFLGWPTVLLLVCISCLLIAAWRSTPRRGKEPPGPTPIPIIGNVFQLNPRNLMESFKEISKKYGPIFTIHLGPKKVVVLYGYDIVKEALIDNGEAFSGRGILPLTEKLFKGTGIVTSNGETWRQLRRFALTTLRDFGMGKKGIEERIQEEAHFLVERIRNTHEKPFNPGKFITHAVSNIICSIVFGDRFDYEDKKFLDLIVMLEENEKYQTGIQIQEKGNSHFTVESLTRTTIDLFLAGTGTTSTTLRYGLLILLKHPEVEEKIHKEIDRVVGRDRSPCMADRSQLPYTDAVIHEIQRFIDFLPLNVPHAVTKDTMLRDYFIPKDTLIFPLLSPILQDCKEFPNPEKFDPGHFLNANGTFRKSDYFMPFSTGKRICAGEGLARMEIFLFLTSILQNFTLKPVVDRKDIDISPLITTFANGPRPYEVSFIPR